MLQAERAAAAEEALRQQQQMESAKAVQRKYQVSGRQLRSLGASVLRISDIVAIGLTLEATDSTLDLVARAMRDLT